MPASADKDSHLDLMLESGDGLRTWSIAEFPAAGEEVVADELPIHRLDYLDYEGPVSNNRGEVSRLDRGTYEIQSETNDALLILMQGEKYRGHLQLKRAVNKTWKLMLHPS